METVPPFGWHRCFLNLKATADSGTAAWQPPDKAAWLRSHACWWKNHSDCRRIIIISQQKARTTYNLFLDQRFKCAASTSAHCIQTLNTKKSNARSRIKPQHKGVMSDNINTFQFFFAFVVTPAERSHLSRNHWQPSSSPASSGCPMLVMCSGGSRGQWSHTDAASYWPPLTFTFTRLFLSLLSFVFPFLGTA